MLRFVGVYKSYSPPGYALQNINFSVEKGEFVFITGPSGAGKTTIIKLITREETPSQGRIFFGNLDISRISRRKIYLYRRKLGIVFQDFRLIPYLTVYENVALPLIVQGKKKRETERRVQQLLKEFEIIHKYRELPSSLSGGEQQRVAIARAVAAAPELLLADEPTGNLDPFLSRKIMKLFKKLNLKGTTVIVATHDISLVEEFGERIIYLSYGKIKKIV